MADFGFSKTPQETFDKWNGHEVALGDIVRVIRTFRPDVICTRFQGASRDGHGNHQASGLLTREAFRAAADPTKFPEQIREGLPALAGEKTVHGQCPPERRMECAVGDLARRPAAGRVVCKVCIPGSATSAITRCWRMDSDRRPSHQLLQADRLGIAGNTHYCGAREGFLRRHRYIASGACVAPRAGSRQGHRLRAELEQIDKQVSEAAAAVDKNPQSAGKPCSPDLNKTRELISKVDASALAAVAKANLLVELRTKQEQFERAANLAYSGDLGIGPGTPDGRPLAEEFDTSNGKVLAAVVTAGKSFLLLAKLHNGSAAPMDIRKFELDVPVGWHYELFMDKVPARIAPGEGCALTFKVSPPLNAQPTKAYFHRGDPETDSLYQIDQPEYVTLPLPPPPVSAHVVYAIEGLQGEVRNVARTPMHGSHGDAWSMPLAVVPPFSVQTSPATQIIPAGANPSAELMVVVHGNSDHSSASVHPKVPSGWKTQPESATAEFARAGEHASEFKVLPDGAKEGRYQVQAVATSQGHEFGEGYSLVARPDIGGFFYYQPALQRAALVDVSVPSGLKVGYIMGAGDDIPTVLRQLGLDVTLLTADDVEHGNLQRFGTIILGIRAYDTREDVKKNNQRLLEYARDGGTLMVQYNTEPADFNKGNFTPYPAQLSRARVSVEESQVTILDPKSPVFHYPNPVGESDFSGWVQERGLYFMDQWTKNTRRCWPATIQARLRKGSFAECAQHTYVEGLDEFFNVTSLAKESNVPKPRRGLLTFVPLDTIANGHEHHIPPFAVEQVCGFNKRPVVLIPTKLGNHSDQLGAASGRYAGVSTIWLKVLHATRVKSVIDDTVSWIILGEVATAQASP